MRQREKKTGMQTALLCAFWFCATPVVADTVTGDVVAVTSGDTLSIRTEEGGFYKIRLMGVDAPELSQTFGKQARAFTRNLVFGKTVTVQYALVDRYKRRIGTVSLQDGTQLNEALVASGHAWHYRALHPVSEVLYRLEKEARHYRLGLWVDDAAVPPWEFRREKAPSTPPQKPIEMDYDRYFDYGLIGNAQTRVYLWPACGAAHSENREEWVRFGSIAAAEGRGYQRASDCPPAGPGTLLDRTGEMLWAWGARKGLGIGLFSIFY